MDPVLKRAQFNKKVNEMTANLNSGSSNTNAKNNNGNNDDDKRPQRRTVSVETRRFAAIRLAANNTTYQQELARMVRDSTRTVKFLESKGALVNNAI